MATENVIRRAAGKESLLSVPVSLPYVDEPILLSVGDRVTIPTEFWNYAASCVNRLKSRTWLSDISNPAITGVVRWLGTLLPISDTQLFAGIQTVRLIMTKGCILIAKFFSLHRTLLFPLTNIILVVAMAI